MATLKQALAFAEDRRKTKEREVETQNELVKSQEANVQRVTQALTAAQAETAKLLQQQGEREQKIFAKQATLREAMEKNRELEKRLRALEDKVR